MVYAEDEKGAQIGEFTRFENGCVAFVQFFDDIYDQHNFNRIVNHIRGERMEIYSHESGKMTYHGEFNEQREREGWGIEYDAKTGAMLLEGIWKGNKLVEIIRKIEGTIMIEFKRNGNNTIASNRIPLYVGEFVYDEEKESFIRNGRGYWIDEETRIATREVEWKDGVEVSGRDLYDGWYTCSTKPISTNNPQQLQQPQQQPQQPQQPPMGDPFATNPQQRAFYQQLFLQLDKEKSHKLSHDAVIAYHSQSGLPKEVLEKLYSMSDLDKDGRLDFAEFVIMTHILFTCRNGVPLPQELPASLIPPSKAHLVKKEEEKAEAEAEEKEEEKEEEKAEKDYFLSSLSSSPEADTINNTMPDICSKQMEQLVIASHSMNHLKELDLSMYKQARSIEIGNECFGSVSTFKIDGLNRLKTIKIGYNSFTQEKNVFGNDESKSFRILNCESLESIQIGQYSFSDFAGDFELKNLPQLRSIQIGTMGSNSWNFYGSSFVIRGIELLLNIVMIRSSKTTIHYFRWLCIL